MSAKKLPLKILQQKIRKENLKVIKILEERIGFVKNKIKFIKYNSS